VSLAYANLEPYYEKWAGLWRPPERLTLSEWAERHFVISSDYGSKSGDLRLFGWQRGIFDAFTDSEVETIVLMCGTQLVKTLFLQVALSYVMAEQPGPALLTQPTDEDAEQFSKERLAPMLRDIPALQGKVADAKSRSTSNTIGFKKFDGGSLSLVGAQKPGNLARRSIRYLFSDETDKYPRSAGSEGDPISLAFERTATYRGRRKIVMCCSPTIKGESRIGTAYSQSDQRKPWVPCWACGAMQVLQWSGVKWDGDTPQPAATARYHCIKCDAPWNDVQRWDACERAEWRADRPFAGTAGFWISHLYNPWKPLSDVVSKFLASKGDRQQLKTFVNTNLAELWEEEGSEVPIPEVLAGRAEDYPSGPDAVVPRRALFLTAGVDVQDKRLEYEVVAWGRGRESWSIEYGVIQVSDGSGDWLPTSDARVWAELDKLLAGDWQHEDGGRMPIMVMTIDTGSRSAPVIEFARRHAQPHYSASGVRVVAPRTVVPIKGAPSEAMKIIATISSEDVARKRYGIRIVSLGQAVIKQELFDALKMPPARGAMPGYCHFPREYRLEYFEGLCSERRIVEDSGKIRYDKIDSRRNEPLDCRVYARGGATIFGIDAFNEKQWAALERMLNVKPTVDDEAEAVAVAEARPVEPTPPPATERRPKPPRVIRNSWIYR